MIVNSHHLSVEEWYADFLRDIEFDDETGEEKGTSVFFPRDRCGGPKS